MKIISWNVNGLRALDKNGGFTEIIKQSPDILCLQETKARQDQLPFYLQIVSQYQSYFSSASKAGYSGVALYTKPFPEKIEYNFGSFYADDEGRIIVAYYPELVLINAYFPNGKASADRLKSKMNFYQATLDFVTQLQKQNKKIIITGDVNTAHQEIDLARPKENSQISGFLPEERAWIDKLINQGFIDSFRLFTPDKDQYTWWSQRTNARQRNIGWRIDYFFVSNNLKNQIKSSRIQPEITGSDHCPISLEVEI